MLCSASLGPYKVPGLSLSIPFSIPLFTYQVNLVGFLGCPEKPDQSNRRHDFARDTFSTKRRLRCCKLESALLKYNVLSL